MHSCSWRICLSIRLVYWSLGETIEIVLRIRHKSQQLEQASGKRVENVELHSSWTCGNLENFSSCVYWSYKISKKRKHHTKNITLCFSESLSFLLGGDLISLCFVFHIFMNCFLNGFHVYFLSIVVVTIVIVVVFGFHLKCCCCCCCCNELLHTLHAAVAGFVECGGKRCSYFTDFGSFLLSFCPPPLSNSLPILSVVNWNLKRFVFHYASTLFPIISENKFRHPIATKPFF